jgi:hypothetical protein
MKDQKISLEQKLKTYSVLAGSVLAFGGAQAQIVYTDIQPDSVLNRGEAILINMNNAGKAEFNIRNHFFAYSSSGYLYQYNMMLLNPNDSNEFLGIQSAITTSTSSTYLYVPNPLQANDNIGPNESFWTEGSSYGFFFASVKYNNSYGSVNIQAGKFLNKEDAYVGVRFSLPSGTDWHYGWIRLDVPNDSTIIVKDFAYESHAGKAIKAGSEYSSLEEKTEDFTIFSRAKTIYIFTQHESAELIIYSITGKQVFSKKINRGQQSIDLSPQASGYYIVKIQHEQGIFTEKVLIN